MAERAIQFVVEVSEALLRAGVPGSLVQPQAIRIASACGVADPRVAVLPNLILATAGLGTRVELNSTLPTEPELRLDQMAEVQRLARNAEHGRVEPGDGIAQLRAIERLPHRFGAAGVVGGHSVVSIGLCLVLQPTPAVLVGAAVFGAFVGGLKLVSRRMQALQVLLPFTAALLVSLVAFAVVPDRTTQGSLRALIPPLVTLLPGAMLTSATLDLAAGHVITGASRLVAGTMQLVLLSLGIAIGAELAGAELGSAINNTPMNSLGEWAPWVGAVVFAAGCFVHFSGPRRSLPWLLLVVMTAFVGQQVGGLVLSDELGAFFGAAVATPVASWVSTRPSGPPALATLMPAFWLLIPGAVALIGVAQFVGSRGASGTGHFVTAMLTFVLIGLGVYVGNVIQLRAVPARKYS